MSTSLNSIKQTCRLALTARAKAIRWHYHRKNGPILQRALDLMPCDDLLYATYISHRNRYVYINNPKTGGSSLKSALVQLELMNQDSRLDYYDWQVYQDKSVIPLTTLNDLKRPTTFTSLLRQDYRFVTFVRNPYSRLLSCYRDKVLKGREEKRKVLRILGRDTDDMQAPLSFEEFTRAVISQTDYEMDHHWRTQTSQILYGLLPYTFIGRFENYEADFHEIFRIIGIDQSEAPELRHFNRTRSGGTEGCEDFFTPELQSLVYDRYKSDFINFGYSHDLPQ